MSFVKYVILHCAIGSVLLGCSSRSATELPAGVNPTIPPAASTPQAAGPDADRTAIQESVIWTEETAQRGLIWTTKDVYLEEGGKRKPLFGTSFTRLHNADVKEAESTLKSNRDLRESEFVKNNPELGLDSTADVVLKSVVGSIVTFEVTFRSVLEGSPANGSAWWLTLDLSKKGQIEPFSELEGENVDCPRIVNLTELFSEGDLVASLAANAEIGNALSAQQRARNPRSLRDLFANEGKYKANPRIEAGDRGKFVTPYSLEHFVFERLETPDVGYIETVGN